VIAMQRVKTGVPGLDELLEGGFPSASAILLVGPPGVGKSTFCQQFIMEGLLEDQPAIYITLDISPEEAKQSLERMGLQKEKEDDIRFVDAYSWRYGKSEAKYSVGNLGNINEFNIAISEAMQNIGNSPVKRKALDSISTLLLYADPKLVVKLIPIIIAKARKAGYVLVLIVEEGVHDPQTVATLNYATDGLIEFKMEGDSRMLRISKMKATKVLRNWNEYEITEKGLTLKKEVS